MNKLTRRLLSLGLSVVTVTGMVSPVFAEDVTAPNTAELTTQLQTTSDMDVQENVEDVTTPNTTEPTTQLQTTSDMGAQKNVEDVTNPTTMEPTTQLQTTSDIDDQENEDEAKTKTISVTLKKRTDKSDLGTVNVTVKNNLDAYMEKEAIINALENILPQQYPEYIISTRGINDSKHSNVFNEGNDTYTAFLDKSKTVTLYFLKEGDKDFKEQCQVTISAELTDEEEIYAVYSNHEINFEYPSGYYLGLQNLVKNADGTFTIMFKRNHYNETEMTIQFIRYEDNKDLGTVNCWVSNKYEINNSIESALVRDNLFPENHQPKYIKNNLMIKKIDDTHYIIYMYEEVWVNVKVVMDDDSKESFTQRVPVEKAASEDSKIDTIKNIVYNVHNYLSWKDMKVEKVDDLNYTMIAHDRYSENNKPILTEENDSDLETVVLDRNQALNTIVDSLQGQNKSNYESALKKGKDIEFTSSVTTTSLDPTSEKAIYDEASRLGYTTVKAFDITLLMDIEGQKPVAITETSSKLRFKVVVPEELKKDGRTFYVLRYHDGKVEKLNIDEDGYFSTDKFSVYMLVYEDKKVDSETENKKEDVTEGKKEDTNTENKKEDVTEVKKEDSNKSTNKLESTKTDSKKTGSKENKSVKTSTRTNSSLFVGVSVLAFTGMAIVSVLKKKNKFN